MNVKTIKTWSFLVVDLFLVFRKYILLQVWTLKMKLLQIQEIYFLSLKN